MLHELKVKETETVGHFILSTYEISTNIYRCNANNSCPQMAMKYRNDSCSVALLSKTIHGKVFAITKYWSGSSVLEVEVLVVVGGVDDDPAIIIIRQPLLLRA